jgi:hypothetical protein
MYASPYTAAAVRGMSSRCAGSWRIAWSHSFAHSAGLGPSTYVNFCLDAAALQGWTTTTPTAIHYEEVLI